MIKHNIPPLYSACSRVLILGSFPSVLSRQAEFFYGHPQNRFWRVLSAIFNQPLPMNIAEKKELVLSHRLALWDVIGSCDITGSADSSIRNVRANDVAALLEHCPIRQIFVNGKTAARYYDRYLLKDLSLPAQCLPSTSPANAAYSLPKLITAWQCVATAAQAGSDLSGAAPKPKG